MQRGNTFWQTEANSARKKIIANKITSDDEEGSVFSIDLKAVINHLSIT
jgi:hypothetical protein